MVDFNLFSNIPPIGHLYFFYGLTFFLLGVSILFKETKASELKLAHCLWLLVGFAFIHGTHEWLELYLILSGQHVLRDEKLLVKAIAVFFLILSFLFLLMFGIRTVLSSNNNKKWVKRISVIPFFLWVIFLVINIGFRLDCQHIKVVEASARPTFGLFGALLTGYGLMKYSDKTKGLSLSVSRKLFYLTNISLNVQILKNRLKGIANPETIGEKLDAIERNVVKASTIAKELLQFSRSTESDTRPVNINQIIRGALTLLQYKFKDIEVHQNLSCLI